MPQCTTTREAFDDAILAGDVETAQAFFAQRHVLDNIRTTNAFIIEAQPTNPRELALPRRTVPWFQRPKRNPTDTIDIPLLSAAERGHVHLFEWLFSHECVSCMGETLAFLLPLIAEYDAPRNFYGQTKPPSDPAVMETLLTSPVFLVVLSDPKQQELLDHIAGHCQTPSIIRLAIAHGARIDEALPSIAPLCITNCVSMLQDEGAMFIGHEILHTPFAYWDCPHLNSLLASGIDRRGPEQLLIEAAADAEDPVVGTLLSVGCIDVDARDDDGRTALMHVASVNPWEDLNPLFFDATPFIAESLLEYCDVNPVDYGGWTALHYAV